jgi:cyclopropane fatty-acyl-phospholipid synthase-like methyltransferase
VTDARVRVVERGYDELGPRFGEWARRIEDDPRERFTGELERRLEPGARVVDLGCGAGVPSTRRLGERFDMLGVDVSREQLALARANVPRARFRRADLTELELPRGSVNAVTAFYSLNHVPREALPKLFERIAGWLAPGGLLLAALGAGGSPDWVGEWLGTTMFFSSWAPAENRRLIDRAGLELLVDEVATLREPEGEARFHWVLARR